MSTHSMPRLTTVALGLATVAAVAGAAPLAAQSGSGGTAPTPTAAPRPYERVNDAQLARALVREQAERLGLVSRIEAIALELDRSDTLGATARLRLQAELEAAMRQLTQTHARVALDVGSRILIERRPSIATTEVRRLLSDAQRRLTSASRTGYMGVTLSPTNNHVRVEDSGELFVRYFEHPSIISIEPGSPAERAGLQRGDVVLAYNDMDVRRELPMHQLLRTGNHVKVRLRRDGRDRSISLTVAAPPANVLGRRADFLVSPAEVSGAATHWPLVRVAPQPLGAAGRAMLTTPELTNTARGAPGAPAAPGGLYRFDLVRGVAGAELTPITSGLAAALGVRRGLLVMRVVPRSPAAVSGLRDGDIVLEANGRVVDDIATLSRIMRQHDGDSRSVTLETLRSRRKRMVELRW